MSAREARTITRRGFALAAVGATGLAYWGRFAIGGTFESHVSAMLGIERRVSDELLATLRSELGADYDARAAAFVAATTAPTRWLMPSKARRQALESFVGPFFGVEQGYVTPFVYGGLRSSGVYRGCNVLIRE